MSLTGPPMTEFMLLGERMRRLPGAATAARGRLHTADIHVERTQDAGSAGTLEERVADGKVVAGGDLVDKAGGGGGRDNSGGYGDTGAGVAGDEELLVGGNTGAGGRTGD